MKSLGAGIVQWGLGLGMMVWAQAASAGGDGKSAAAAAPADGKAQVALAQKRMKALYEAVWHIERVRAAAGNRPVRASCVEERLADARAHVRLGGDELAALQEALAAPGAQDAKQAAAQVDRRAWALTRLAMLEQRTHETERAALTCVNDDASGVDVFEVSVEIAPTTVDREMPGLAPAPAPTATTTAKADVGGTRAQK